MGNLVLRRRVGETIAFFVAGREIGTVTVLSVERVSGPGSGGVQVTLKCDFGDDVTVLRGELVQADRHAGEQRSNGSTPAQPFGCRTGEVWR